jgi:hypothetical protein
MAESSVYMDEFVHLLLKGRTPEGSPPEPVPHSECSRLYPYGLLPTGRLQTRLKNAMNGLI